MVTAIQAHCLSSAAFHFTTTCSENGINGLNKLEDYPLLCHTKNRVTYPMLLKSLRKTPNGHHNNAHPQQSLASTTAILHHSTFHEVLAQSHHLFRQGVSIQSKTLHIQAIQTQKFKFSHTYNQPCSNHVHIPFQSHSPRAIETQTTQGLNHTFVLGLMERPIRSCCPHRTTKVATTSTNKT